MTKKPEVVISGLSGRFPAADSLEEFEYKLFNKIEMVTVDDSRWPVGLFNLPKKNGKIRAIDKFDAEFFEFPQKIVNHVDPQERLFLELTYESLIDAGIDPESLRGTKTGFFWGSCFLETHGDFDDPINIPKTLRSSITRVSTFFEFKGPTYHSDTACNSSLNALNDAIISIQTGQCDRAIVAGSNTCFRPLVSVRFRDMKMISKDGTCKCLDESADGYCRSEAVVVVLLERKDLAKRIYATILHSKSGSDGFKEEGITFPSQESQRRLAQETYDEIGLNPDDIGYIESHVTGTAAGDPVEMNAVYDVICTKKKDPLLIGCIKSSIGHAEGASGLCSVAKACIIMQTRLIPPNLHYKNPNPNVRGLMDGKMKPVTEVTPLPGKLIPVNSFGFGGANTHLVLEGLFKDRCPGSVADPVPRLVNTCGRTPASVSYILSRIEQDSKYLNNDFLALLNSFSRVAKDKMTYRGYMIIIQGERRVSFEKVHPQKVISQERPWLVFRQLVSSSVNPESLLNVAMFKKSLQDFSQYLPEKYEFDESLSQLAHQIAWSDTLKQLALDPQGVLGYGIGALARVYFEGKLSKKQVAECALLVNEESNVSKLTESISRVAHQHDKNSCRELAIQMLSKELGMNGTPKGSLVLEAGMAGLFERGEKSDEDSLLRSIRTLGKVYMNGQNVLIEKLYPKVEYPIPSNTPSLGSLLKWDHHKEYSLKPYLMQDAFFQKCKKIFFRCDRRNHDDAFFFDHKIDERILFPATGYLMLAWTAFSKFSNVAAWDIPVEFKDVAFKRATVMNKNAETNLSTVIDESTGGFVISDGDTVVVTGCIRHANAIKPLEIPESEDKIVLDAKQIYREFRVRGYDYGSYFQGLMEAECDGREGKLIWRDVMPKSIKEALNVDSDDEQALLWIRSWVAFVDSMFQLDLLRNENESRLLFVPTKIDSLICIPDVLNQSIQSSPTITDALTLSEARVVTAKCCAEQIWTKGIWIRGLKITQLKRKPQHVCEIKESFVPLAEDAVLDLPGQHLINKYLEACEKALVGDTDHDFEIDDPKCALLKSIITKEKLDLSTDYLAGNFDDEFFYSRNFLYPLIHIVSNSTDVRTETTTPLEVLEINSTKHVIGGKIFQFWDEIFLHDTFDLRYTLIHPDTSHLDSNQTNGMQVVTSPSMSIAGLKPKNFIIFKWGADNSEELLQSLHKNLTDNGFVAITVKDETRSEQVEKILRSVGITNTSSNINNILSAAEKLGLVMVKQQILHETTPLKAFLFRKRSADLESITHRVIEIGISEQEKWFEDLKLFMREFNEDNDKRIWLVPKRDPNVDNGSCATGIVGLTKSLRLEEGGERLRCIVDFSVPKVDINDPKYQDVVRRDLTINIFNSDLKCWGFHQPSLITDEEVKARPTQYAYLRSLKQGDMSSLAWVESDLKTIKDENNNLTRQGKLIDVHYSALNFRDIMFASGQLDSEAIPGIHPDIAQDSILGLEFSGTIPDTKRRVMGICPYKALATKVFIEDEEVDFTWPVPEGWSLEDAATVPVVYATAYYALIIRGKLCPGESVLIHSGCGGVGLAAIRICLSMGCTVYTTCGSEIKRKYLTSHFPDLVSSGNKIFNSRSISFEEQILIATDGHGVDVVLNSLAEDKLQASLRCLARNGRFLEIGKVDFIRNHALFAHQMYENQSFHGVLLDALFKYKKRQVVPDKIIKEKRWLKELLRKGIDEGTVIPLDRTVFKHTQTEEAFRYMTTGKHIGKVLMQMRTSENTDLVIPSLKASYCYPNKSYIVLGGLGGFGLELVHWLAHKGARMVTIASRSGVREAYQRYSLLRMKRMGVKVRICTADITKEEGCRELLMQSISDGPVGGIFNAAVVYKDKLFQDQSISVFKEVCGPKSEATRHFDRLSRSLCPQLDYFLTFSSLSANRGNAGQTNYNFANSIMDSICEERVRDGLPGLSIQWGVVGDVGIVADSANSNEMVLLGSRAQRMHSCFEFIDKYLQANYPTCVSYVKAESDQESDSGSETIDILSVITRLLGLKDLASVDSEMTLGGLGVDSLIAVEIKQALDKTFGSSISIREVRDLTISALMKMSSSAKAIPSTSSKTESQS